MSCHVACDTENKRFLFWLKNDLSFTGRA